MDFEDLKEIKDKRNRIENIKCIITEKLSELNNIIVCGVFENILDDIDNNVEINKDSLYSIYDWNTEPKSKELILDNIKLIDNLGLLSFINYNDYEKSFSKITDEINTFIINQFDLDKNIELDNYLNYDLENIIDKVCDNDFDEIEFIDYLDNILDFYDSFLNTIDYMNLHYKDYY